MEKLVYHLDRSGFYIGASPAIKDPLEDNIYLVPAFATDLIPPTIDEGDKLKFNGTDWEIIKPE